MHSVGQTNDREQKEKKSNACTNDRTCGKGMGEVSNNRPNIKKFDGTHVRPFVRVFPDKVTATEKK